MDRGDVAELAGSVGLGAWTALAVLTMVVVGGDGTPLFLDSGLLSWSLAHRPDAAVALARGVTATGTGVVPYALVVPAGLAVGRTARQRVTATLLGLGCLLAGQLTRAVLMNLVARPRPPHADWRTHASGWAFPSGHTTTSALTAGLLVVALCVRAPRGRGALCAVAGCWAVLVGLTRIYLGVHWFTDVIGGWLFAAGWLGLCLAAAARWLPPRLVHDATGTPREPDDAP
ncbi:phosphatase PAP2 family protein [Streptomyces sp. NPDC047000]|uniref:phosphatase PAP2 family protein n=1 Tax=Streptomyces sp. NPDC047000 TaxID=3155474 RepID=UPI0034092750